LTHKSKNLQASWTRPKADAKPWRSGNTHCGTSLC